MAKTQRKKNKDVNQGSIARSLNLSVATVSKALGDSSEINADTRAKVVNMASKLGYSYTARSRDAEASASGSRMVGVLIHSRPEQWQHTTYFAGMSEKCAKLNVSLMLHYFRTDEREHVLNPEYQPPVLREGQLSGLIFVNRWPSYIVKRLMAQMPCVSVVHETPDVQLDVVGSDDVGGMATLMDHLYSLGHRKIGFFGRCSDETGSRKRFSGYVSSLCRLGLDFDPASVCDVSVEQLENRTLALDALMDCTADQIHQGVRAWMCANDRIGYALCKGLMDRGFRVPQDVSITGFDNMENDKLGCPDISTMAVPALKIGAEALRRLMTRIRHPHGPVLHVELQCRFIDSASTSPPPAQALK